MPDSHASRIGAAPTPAPVLCSEVAAPPALVWISRLPARTLSGLIWLYQRTLSPALVAINPTCGCRFAPTCSHYARESLREHGLGAGLALAIIRLAKCGPWHPGGEDPVPPRTPPVCRAVRRQA